MGLFNFFQAITKIIEIRIEGNGKEWLVMGAEIVILVALGVLHLELLAYHS